MTSYYKVHQSSDDVVVVQNAVEILRLEMKFLWSGARLCKLFEGDKVILEYKVSGFFATKYKIIHSLLDPFEVTKSVASCTMHYKGHLFSRRQIVAHRHTFLYQDNFEAGYGESGFQHGLPFVFNLCMHGISEHEYYIIIFYLMTLSPPE